MSLIKKIFGADKGTSDSTQFRESRSAPGGQSVGRTVSENAPRRDLVQVVLRETMRKHGIPSDWIDCRTLSVLTRQHKQGMHVQFIVRKGDEQLLEYVHAFQASFWREIERFEPRARDFAVVRTLDACHFTLVTLAGFSSLGVDHASQLDHWIS